MNLVLLSTLGLSPYRTVELVEPSLDLSVFQTCTNLSNGLYTLRFSVHADGKASLLDGEDCFSAIERVTFPKSPTSNDIFMWDIIHQDGSWFPQLLRKESPKIIFPGIFAQEKERMLEGEGKDNAE